MSQVNHKTTIESFKLIFVKAKGSKLSFGVNKELTTAFKQLSSLFTLTHIQCALFSIVFAYTIDDELERVKTLRLIDFLGLEYESFFDLKGDLEVLINRGFIKQLKEDRTENLLNSSFTVNQKLIDMLFRNEQIQFEKLYGNGYNFTQFARHMYRINNDALLNFMSSEDVYASVIEHENRNENLTQILALKSLELDVKDRLIIYYLVHKLQHENESTIRAYSVCFDVLGAAETLMYIQNLSLNKSQLQVQELIELVNSSDLRLTSKAKELLLYEIADSIVVDEKSEVETSHFYIKYNSIPERKLYFNSDIQRELNILQTLLQKDNFNEYQCTMQEMGNKNEGISILLYGPSGTGKSSIVDELARKTQRNIFQVDLSVVRSKWWGESEKNIKKIFEEYSEICSQSDNTPILLFNECDALLGKRNDAGEDRHDFTEATMTNMLLEFFEKNKGIIVGITNIDKNLDSAFLRRFTVKYYIGNPDRNAVKSILKSKLDFLSDKEIGWIADRHSLTGGQIFNILQKCTINRIITKSNPTVSEVMDFCEDEKIKTNPWKEEY